MILKAIAGQNRRVQAEGEKSAKICFIGEAPGSREVSSGRPFSGPAGFIFDQCLHAAGLIRGESYITNLFKTRILKKKRQTKTDIYSTDNSLLWHYDKGFTEEGLSHVASLMEELRDCSANVFVPLGNPSLLALTNKKYIYQWRGSVLPCPGLDGRKALPTIHPASCLRSGDYIARYYIQFDFQRVRKEAGFPELRRPPQRLIINPTVEEVLNKIASYKEACLQGRRLNYDVEIINQEISAISLAVSYSESISIPFDGRYNVEEESRIWTHLCDLFEDERISKVNQNISFDNNTLLETMGILVQGKLDDTMVACGHLYPDFPKGLDFITSVWTDNPYYKDEGKIWFKGMGTDKDKFYEYSALDSACAWEGFNRLSEELSTKGYLPQYERNMSLFPVLSFMEQRGIKVDREELEKVKKELQQEQERLQTELDKIVTKELGVPTELNVKSTKQKIEYFYHHKGIKPYTNQGRPTTDEKAMVKLAKGTKTRPGIPEAQLVLDITRIRSAIEKYYNIQFDTDNRLRCSINPKGTTTGRLSTGKRIRTNTGGNMQNIPEDFRRFLVADPGYVMFEIDKSQAEWVIVAYYGGDARMLEIIENGLDPHSRTGQLITSFPDLDIIRAEAKLAGHETNPDNLRILREENFPEIIRWINEGHYVPRNMTIRQCGKKSNHGGNYGMGYKRAAREWEIPEYEAQRILPLYHRAYPGVENGFQQGIINSLSKDRSVTNCFGRRREFLGPIDWSNKNSKTFEEAFGFLPQSTVADLLNQALIQIYEDSSGPMKFLEPLMQIHDSILFQIPNNLGEETIASVIFLCARYMNPELEYFGRKFYIESDLKVGYSWGTLEEVKLGTTIEGLAGRLSGIL